MKKTSSFYLIFFFVSNIFGQIEVGDNSLQIVLQNNITGVELQSINSDGLETLEENSYLFYLYITDISTQVETRISATSGWDSVQVNNDGTNCEIIFSQPQETALPATLSVKYTLQVLSGVSTWDLAINGLGNNHTLTRVNFPKFKIKTPGNDTFFIPKFSGKTEHNPLANAINYDLTYPRGRLGASMPFAAYYNQDYGVYLAFHDPDAALKNLVIQQENNYVKYYGLHSIPDQTKAGNDWELPGVFVLELYQGEWFEATMIYKNWVTNNATYFPQESAERNARQQAMGTVDVWGMANPYLTRTVDETETDINDFIHIFPDNIRVGIHWYKWYNYYHDDNYPEIFPERDGFADAVQRIQQSGTLVMPYMNGMLYDTDLASYPTLGEPYAAKDINGDIFPIDFGDSEPGATVSTFAFMCPSQTPWQDILVDSALQIVNRLDTKAVYVDMLAWAGGKECMDETHGHPLASGHWWQDSYVEFLTRMHDNFEEPERFITVEGATDNLSNVIDGFLVSAWQDNNLVPAFQSIYTGKNQFFGVIYGGSTYNDPSFYAKFSSAFVNNIQPGRMFLWFAHDPNADATARSYIINLAVMHHKLQNFMSFGEMQHPFEVTGNIPDITADWGDEVGDVTVSALQKNTYLNKTKDSVAFVFSNASMTESLNFDFEINGSSFGLTGDLDVQLITPNTDNNVVTQSNSYTQSVSLQPMEIVAYLITSNQPTTTVSQLKDNLFQVYPNPADEQLQIIIPENEFVKSIEILSVSGQSIYYTQENTKILNTSSLAKGLYILKVISNNQIYQTKFLKK